MKRICLAALSLAAIVLTAPASALEGTFAVLDGAWAGAGSVRLDNGKTERLRCRGYYNAKAGNTLGMAINCNNASLKIHMRANLRSVGNDISGTWEEREFNQTGSIAGRRTASGFNLKFSGPISGSMAVSLRGSRQTVSISTGGPGFTNVNLQFAKNG